MVGREKNENAVVMKLKRQCLAEVADVASMASLFFEAADAERRMPLGIHLGVQTGWVDVLHDSHEAYGYDEEEERLKPASAKAVMRYDLALQLTPLMARDEARLVWECARSAVRRKRGPAWRKIGKKTGVSGQTVKRRFERAILQLWYVTTYSLRVSQNGV